MGTGPIVEQYASIPELYAGIGIKISSAVYDIIDNWSLTNKVKAFVFDTTASNTGKLNGACGLLEQKIGRDILYFRCR